MTMNQSAFLATSFLIKNFLMRRASYLWVAFCILSLSAPALSQTQSEIKGIVKTLVAGLKAREDMLESKAISGVATERRYRTQWDWETLDTTSAWKAEKEKGVLRDRDMALIQFNLSENQWFYEIQQLLWSGGNSWFRTNYKRQAFDVSDLYKRVACDGRNIYRFTRQYGRPMGHVEDLNQPNPGLHQLYFRRWFSLSLNKTPFSQTLAPDNKAVRLMEVKKEKVGERDTYLVIFANNGDKDIVTESRVWIAPDADFVVVKWENLNLIKNYPNRGMRFVVEWSNLKKVNGITVPFQCIEQDFFYREDRPNEDLRMRRELVFNWLKIEDKFDFNPFYYTIPVGTILDGWNGNAIGLLRPSGIDQQKATKEYQQSQLSWEAARQFASSALPQTNAAYKGPLPTDALKSVSAKYQFAIP